MSLKQLLGQVFGLDQLGLSVRAGKEDNSTRKHGYPTKGHNWVLLGREKYGIAAG